MSEIFERGEMLVRPRTALFYPMFIPGLGMLCDPGEGIIGSFLNAISRVRIAFFFDLRNLLAYPLEVAQKLCTGHFPPGVRANCHYRIPPDNLQADRAIVAHAN